MDGADIDFAGANLNGSIGILQERSVPTPRFRTPRPHKDTTLDYHRPYADESVRHFASFDADSFAIVDGGDDLALKSWL